MLYSKNDGLLMFIFGNAFALLLFGFLGYTILVNIYCLLGGYFEVSMLQEAFKFVATLWGIAAVIHIIKIFIEKTSPPKRSLLDLLPQDDKRSHYIGMGIAYSTVLICSYFLSLGLFYGKKNLITTIFLINLF